MGEIPNIQFKEEKQHEKENIELINGSAMTAGMLAGCGSKTDAPADNTAKEETPATEEAKEETPATEERKL